MVLPVKKFSVGGIHVAVWENAEKDGSTFYSCGREYWLTKGLPDERPPYFCFQKWFLGRGPSGDATTPKPQQRGGEEARPNGGYRGPRPLFHSISFERRYTDETGQWKYTNSLKVNDLPKAVLAL